MLWRPPPARCSSVDPAVACETRRAEQRAGRFLWGDDPHTGRSGWVYPVDPFRMPPWRALPRVYWRFCPFCGGTLPLAPGVRPPLPSHPPDPQADGGPGDAYGDSD